MPSTPLESERPAIARLLSVWPPAAIDALIAEACALWGVSEFAGTVNWRWNSRLRTTLGRACLTDQVLEFNPILLARHPDEMRPLLLHELAHLVAYADAKARRVKIAPHGAEWKALMRAVGCSTRATHQLNVDGLRVKKTRRRRRRRRIWFG